MTVSVYDGEFTGSDTFDLTVTNINDAPSAEDLDLTTFEDTTLFFTTGTWTGVYTDVDDDPINYVLIQPMSTGVMYVGVSAITSNTLIYSYDLGNVTYEPPSNRTGDATALFRMNDGTATSPGTETLTITVLDQNDTPTVT